MITINGSRIKIKKHGNASKNPGPKANKTKDYRGQGK